MTDWRTHSPKLQSESCSPARKTDWIVCCSKVHVTSVGVVLVAVVEVLALEAGEVQDIETEPVREFIVFVRSSIYIDKMDVEPACG